MGIVYRAQQLSLERDVALKVLAPDVMHDELLRERLRREGRSVASLTHPNIVAIYDSGEVDGAMYLAMALVPGGTLADRITQGDLSARETLSVLGPIADALDAAHRAGVVHREVKPQNILIGDEGQPYLADFGAATGLPSQSLTAAGEFVGSFAYAAPEQLLGDKVTYAADVYGLCAVLFHCLTLRLPYPRDNHAGVLNAHLHAPPPTVEPWQPAGAEFNALIARGMAKRPGRPVQVGLRTDQRGCPSC